MTEKPASKPGDALKQPVVCRGQWYESQSALARALGITQAAVSLHLTRGTIDRCGLRDGKRIRGNEA